ncbi:hypothetical protein NHX12_016456 [Muraenolepis orangiensis]|uniref:DUF4371 domain-containing protein n=1 Tax=Muraenolepis orangiensis TaxID=630683 RepID=A0A9Q0D5L8_9TELE|nr:hypothetical protein NHX12_016456 [Muraenolepis orangiensis]
MIVSLSRALVLTVFIANSARLLVRESPLVFLRGLVDFVSSLDTVLEEHLKTATVFKGTSKTVQNELLDSMLSVLREYILEEVNSADFIAIQADKTTDVSTYCQLVLVLRYIDIYVC